MVSADFLPHNPPLLSTFGAASGLSGARQSFMLVGVRAGACLILLLSAGFAAAADLFSSPRVPHIRIEESIAGMLGESHTCVVTSVPDESRGERLVAFFTDPAMTGHALWERLCQTDLPRLWLPKREDIHHVDAIPTLGTGKTDLRRVRQMAAEVVCQ